MRERMPCVYILGSGERGTLYIGVTYGLIQRVWRHIQDQVPGFTRKYRIHTLVRFEQHVPSAISLVIPANAGIHLDSRSTFFAAWSRSKTEAQWIPAFAGMTGVLVL